MTSSTPSTPSKVLALSVADNLEPKLSWLQERPELDDESLSKLVQTMPPILGLSAEENLDSTLSWLQERFDIDDKSRRHHLLLFLFPCGAGITGTASTAMRSATVLPIRSV
jgi:hypothetical protein